MKKRKILLGVLTLTVTLIGTVGIGTSLAYFTDQENVVNDLNFVGENGLDAILTEPGWNPEKGLLNLPGETITKDPQVTNTSEIDLDELVALQVDFVYGTGCPDEEKVGQLLSEEDMKYVYEVYDIDWNADNDGDWIRFDMEYAKDRTQRFYYADALKRNLPNEGDTTEALFTAISIDKSVNNEQYSHIQEIGGFDIKISGMIIQQMTGENIHGLNSAKEAYEAGLFTFEKEEGEVTE